MPCQKWWGKKTFFILSIIPFVFLPPSFFPYPSNGAVGFFERHRNCPELSNWTHQSMGQAPLFQHRAHGRILIVLCTAMCHNHPKTIIFTFSPCTLMTFIFKRPTHTYDHSSNVHRNWKHTPDDGSFMDRNMSGRIMITTQPTQLSGSSGQF